MSVASAPQHFFFTTMLTRVRGACAFVLGAQVAAINAARLWLLTMQARAAF